MPARPRVHHAQTLLRIAFCAAFFVAFSVGTQRASAANDSRVQGLIVLQSGDAYIAYDGAAHVWEIGTSRVRRRTQFDATNGYRAVSLVNQLTNREWLSEGTVNSEFQFALNGETIASSSPGFSLGGYETVLNPDGSIGLVVTLTRGPLAVRLYYAIFPGTSIIEQWTAVVNSSGAVLPALTDLDSFSMFLGLSPDLLTVYWVQGLSPVGEIGEEPNQVPALELRSLALSDGVSHDLGSRGRSSEDDMGWFALSANGSKEGMFAGIEWSGAWLVHLARAGGITSLQGGLRDFRHDLAPGETFQAPRRFLGFYSGDLDDAANASHDFARRYLLRPRPKDFPWTQYNTWFAHYINLNEQTLRQEVDIAAALGLEVFYVDAGWYEGSPNFGDFSFGLGTWRENRDKFPSGLAAFSDYVHSKGMKFGLWVEPERVDLDYVGPGKEVPAEWLSPLTDFSAVPPPATARSGQICLGHPEARAWVKTWLTRLIRDYKLDWLKWDSNLWMPCDPPDQPGDANYAHIQGLYEILDYLRQEFPNLIIEDCASGGNRMDYALMRRTDIAWLSDETDPSYRVRYHVAGASYPFPPEYLNSWLVESYFEHIADGAKDPELMESWLHSRMMGAFGILTKMTVWNETMLSIAADEIKEYKSIRDIIANGKVYRLLPQTDLQTTLEPPAEPDAAEFFDPSTDTGVIFLFQGKQSWASRQIAIKGLQPDTLYQLTSEDGTISLQRQGKLLAQQGIILNFDDHQPSTLVFIMPANAPRSPDIENKSK